MGSAPREREILSWSPDEAENTPFTPDEQTEIVKHLEEIKDYVKNTYSLSQDPMVALEEGFKQLAAATTRLGRNDWPDAVHGFLWMALHVFQHFFGVGTGRRLRSFRRLPNHALRLFAAPVFGNDARQVIAFGAGLRLHVGAQYGEARYKRG